MGKEEGVSVDALHIESLEVEKTQEEIKIDGNVQLIHDDVVQRIPAPSNDPNDPLNFPQWRKAGIMVILVWFSIFSLLSISGLGTVMNTLYGMYEAQGVPETTVAGLTTYPTMVMAIGSFVLLPISFIVGRRPVFLATNLVCFITFITAGASKNFYSQFISRIFTGLATGSVETLLPLIIADMTFLDQRGLWFGIYWSMNNAINAGVLLAMPYIVAHLSWRWYYWFFAIIMGAGLVGAILFVPETRFSRPPQSLSGKTVFTDEFGHTHVLDNDEAIARFGNVPTANDHEPKPKKTFIQEMKPWSSVAPNALQIWLKSYVQIFKSLTSPGVVWALLLSSISLGTAIGITVVYSTVLEENYHWSAESVGLFNAGIIPASLLSMFYCGWFGDRFVIWMAKRNGGVHEPEHWLLTLVIPIITSWIGLVAMAFCANWPERYSVWGLIIGWAIYEFGFTCIIITTTTFAAEVWPKNPGAAMVFVIGGKNLVSFGAAQGLVPMVFKFSYLTAFMILLGIFGAIALLGIPVYYLNPKWRKATAEKANSSTI